MQKDSVFACREKESECMLRDRETVCVESKESMYVETTHTLCTSLHTPPPPLSLSLSLSLSVSVSVSLPTKSLTIRYTLSISLHLYSLLTHILSISPHIMTLYLSFSLHTHILSISSSLHTYSLSITQCVYVCRDRDGVCREMERWSVCSDRGTECV